MNASYEWDNQVVIMILKTVIVNTGVLGIEVGSGKVKIL